MNSDALETQLITFMYFLYSDNGGTNSPEKFYEDWSERFYTFDDLSEGKYYE